MGMPETHVYPCEGYTWPPMGCTPLYSPCEGGPIVNVITHINISLRISEINLSLDWLSSGIYIYLVAVLIPRLVYINIRFQARRCPLIDPHIFGRERICSIFSCYQGEPMQELSGLRSLEYGNNYLCQEERKILQFCLVALKGQSTQNECCRVCLYDAGE